AAAEEIGVSAWFTDHAEALERTGPELVSIVTPPLFHCRQTLDAFAAGAHVLCEKPLAMNADEARQMVAAAESAGKFLSMGLQSRHLEAGRILRRVLAEGTLGQVFFSRVWCGHIMNIPGWGHFHHQSLAGGGVVMATTVHILDFVLWVLGNPKAESVTAFTYAKLPRMREPAVTWEGGVAEFTVEDFAHATIRFEDGSWMSLESNWLMHPNPRPTGVEILAADGRAWLHPLKIEVEHGQDVEDVTPEVTETPSPVTGFLQEAVRCAREGGEPVVRPQEVVQVQAVLDAIYRSAREGRTVPVEA
ncbi:MAG TPA: Gfo/Idh/MocA family oxidoreductase, partial [Armatimonadota bacterium]|nr:Gfo/Idh/MocA family oxidoreductase [Armatimonadota bacterium]